MALSSGNSSAGQTSSIVISNGSAPTTATAQGSPSWRTAIGRSSAVNSTGVSVVVVAAVVVVTAVVVVPTVVVVSAVVVVGAVDVVPAESPPQAAATIARPTTTLGTREIGRAS